MKREDEMNDSAFDAMLDEYQEREAEMAIEREMVGNQQAVRPDAKRLRICFSELLVGDFMTAESGTDARWVEVVEVRSDGDHNMKVTFRTPQPLGVGRHDRWVIDRDPGLIVVIDESARGS